MDLEVELGEEELAEVEQAYVHVAAKMPQDVREGVDVSHLSVWGRRHHNCTVSGQKDEDE